MKYAAPLCFFFVFSQAWSADSKSKATQTFIDRFEGSGWVEFGAGHH